MMRRMFNTRFIGLLLISMAGISFFLPSTTHALSCQHVRQLTAEYLKMHFSFDTFNKELSERTLDNFIRAWDPGRLYFYDKDVEEFRKKYSERLYTMINAGDCSAIDDVVGVFSRRFEERHRYVNHLIGEKHDFTVEESIDLDRRNLAFASTQEELNERWRKRIKFQILQLLLADTEEKVAKERLSGRYQRAVKRHNEQTIEEVYSAFLNAFSTSLDPHSSYMPAQELEDFRINTRLSLEGIGAVLRSEDGFTIIQSLVPGGAALKTAKVQVDDKIIAVAQGDGEPVDVIDMDLREVVRLIRGTRGTIVTLTLLRGDGSEARKLRVPIVRERIQLEDRIARSEVIEVEVEKAANDSKEKTKQNYRIGVINLPSFYVDFEGMHAKTKDYRSSARDVEREITKLKKQKVDALVVDLRSNGGGSLDESVRVAGLFFDKGPVVQIRTTDGRTFPHAVSDNKTLYDGPLILMINRQSASASEILAGVIQDMERGIVVGDSHTFGKGTVQNLNDMGGRLGATKITISKFYRPSGSSTQLRGVESDIVFPSLSDQLEIGEKHYDYALPWEQIKKIDHPKFNQVTAHLDAMKKRSNKRIGEDDGFKEIKRRISEFKEKEAERYLFSLRRADHEGEETAESSDDVAAVAEAEPGLTRPANETRLEDDFYLQETVRIAADYVQLIAKQNPGIVSIPSLRQAVKVADKDEKKAKENTAQTTKSVSGEPETSIP